MRFASAVSNRAAAAVQALAGAVLVAFTLSLG
jgi:hypothetical protein